jgi:hypothetical protein
MQGGMLEELEDGGKTERKFYLGALRVSGRDPLGSVFETIVIAGARSALWRSSWITSSSLRAGLLAMPEFEDTPKWLAQLLHPGPKTAFDFPCRQNVVL